MTDTLRRALPATALIGLIGAALVWALLPPAEAQAEREPTERHTRVVVSSAVEAPAAREHVFYAATRPADEAFIAFAQGGRMVERLVEVGERVEEGQVVARLDPQPLRHQVQAASAQIRQLDAQIEQLERESARAARLLSAELGTEQAVEQLDAQGDALRAARDGAAVQRSEARRLQREAELSAPYAGVVAQVFVDAGEVVAPGTPVVMIVDPAATEVEIDTPENVFAAIEVGMAVSLDFPLSGRTDVEGTVVRSAGVAPGMGRLFPVVVRVDDTSVVAGMAAEVRFSLPEEPGVAVPLAAILDPVGSASTVFRVVDEEVERVPVSVVRVAGDLAVVRGIALGDPIVSGGVASLVDGQRVEVAQ